MKTNFFVACCISTLASLSLGIEVSSATGLAASNRGMTYELPQDGAAFGQEPTTVLA